MNRKDFLRGVGLAGFSSLIPFKGTFAGEAGDTALEGCTLIPTETEGPFPLDLTENQAFFRSDVREDRAGARFNLKIKINGVGNCGAMSGVRVNIWHCDKDGFYSGYDNSMNPGQAGLTYLRGYQITDSNGEVNFTTIFPGWYQGRICHIHFQVRTSSSYAVVSQMSFDPAAKNAVYANNSSIYTKGADPMTFSSDNIFSDGYSLQLCSLTQNSDGSYDGYFEAAVAGNGTGIGHIEKQNAKYYALGDLYPNPVGAQAQLPLTLLQPATVKCLLFDINGRNLGEVCSVALSAGTHELSLDLDKYQLPAGNYAYVVRVIHADGVFGESRVLTKK